MRKTIKILGVIAITAIFGITMAACGTAGGVAGDATTAGGMDLSALPAMEWPEDSVWAEHGLSGLYQPAGEYRVIGHRGGMLIPFVVGLLDATSYTYENIRGQMSAMSGMTLAGEATDENGAMVSQFVRQTETDVHVIVVAFIPNDNILLIQPQ